VTVAVLHTGSSGVKTYVRWLTGAGPDLDFLTLSHSAGNLDVLDRCQGVVFTGGGDVDPGTYGRVDATHLVEGVDAKRDRFELAAVRRGMELQLPIIGICRGMQLFNVAMGGTLIPDLNTVGFAGHRKGKRGDRVHEIAVEEGTLLHRIVGRTRGLVNTNHHQAVDRVGEGLRVAARADDGVIEAMEWEHASDHPFLQLVQWHPERIRDPQNPMCAALAEGFVRALHLMRAITDVLNR
jgi:putative glutamine amidotransferase